MQRVYSSPRKYQLNLATKVATEVWNYDMDKSVFTPVCGSIYEDAPLNYLVDYSIVIGAPGSGANAQLLGLDAGGNKVSYYQYGPTDFCNTAFNAIPLHLENTKFPSVGPQALNLSTRGYIAPGEKALIGGFIVSGSAPKTVALRLLGPSLSQSGVGGVLADPVLTLYNSADAVIATNDNWQTDPAAAALTADGLAPANPAEAATIQTLSPGNYTIVGAGKGAAAGIGLVEAYDISTSAASRLANISTRGFVQHDENVLISGLIVGDVANATVIIRALGPSLPAYVDEPLGNLALAVYDGNGTLIGSNDDWRNDPGKIDIIKNGLAPASDLESAALLHPPAGAYTAVVNGVDNSVGIGLVEVFDLDP